MSTRFQPKNLRDARNPKTPPERLLVLAQSTTRAVQNAAHANPNLSEGVLRVWLSLGSPYAWTNPQRPLTLMNRPATAEVLRGLPRALGNARALFSPDAYADFVRDTRGLLKAWWESETQWSAMLGYLAAIAESGRRSPSHVLLIEAALRGMNSFSERHTTPHDARHALDTVAQWRQRPTSLNTLYDAFAVGRPAPAEYRGWGLAVRGLLLLTLDPHFDDAPSLVSDGLCGEMENRVNTLEMVEWARNEIVRLCHELREWMPEPPLA